MEYCCKSMKHHLEFTCAQHGNDSCPDKVLHRYSDGVIGMPIYPGGSYIKIDYCPFCGKEV